MSEIQPIVGIRGEGHFLEEQWYPHKEMPTAGRVVEESQIVPI